MDTLNLNIDDENKSNKTKNKSNFYSYEEKLLSVDGIQSTKTYEVEIFAKRTKLFPSMINFDHDNKEIIISPKSEDFKIKVSFMDFIGFVGLEDLEHTEANKINLIFPTENRNVEYASLNFYSKYSIRSCLCLGVFCCKCIEYVTERKAKFIELLMEREVYKELRAELLNVSYQAGDKRVKELTIKHKRKILLFLNTSSGRGNALEIWNRAKKIFDLASLKVDICRTKRARHAYDHTFSLDINEYCGIICSSGDGILHEVINAIFHREDRDAFMHNVPIGSIPGGTSNGFAKTVCDVSGEECTPENCAYIVTKGEVRDFDIQEIETISGEKNYSMLMISWGIIADIDLESETLRCMGSGRYTIYGLWRWMWLRKAFADLYYLPENVELKHFPSIKDNLDLDKFVLESSQYSFFIANNLPFSGETMKLAPLSRENDGFCDIVKMKAQSGKLNLAKLLLNDSGDYFTKTGEIKPNSGVEYIKTKCWRLVPRVNLESSDSDLSSFNTYYSIDGERYPIEPIQVRTLPKALRVFCFNSPSN